MQQGRMIRVSSKGQIVLPKLMREKMDIHEGDYIFVQEIEDGVLILEKQPALSLDNITSALRKEARSKGTTRKEIEQAVEEARRAGER